MNSMRIRKNDVIRGLVQVSKKLETKIFETQEIHLSDLQTLKKRINTIEKKNDLLIDLNVKLSSLISLLIINDSSFNENNIKDFNDKENNENVNFLLSFNFIYIYMIF